MPAGRPTKYTPELLNKCYQYIDEWKNQGDMIPSHEGLMLFVGISKTCCYDWAREEDKEEFSSILDNILVMQRRELINKGLSSEFNSNITKLVLGKHGYHEKQETDITSGGKEIKNEWHIHPVTTRKDAKD